MIKRLKWLNIFVLTALIIIYWFMSNGGIDRVYYIRITPLFQLVYLPIFISSGMYIFFSFIHAYKEKQFSWIYIHQIFSLSITLLALFYIPEIYILTRTYVQIWVIVLMIINILVIWVIYNKYYVEEETLIEKIFNKTIKGTKKVANSISNVEKPTTKK